MLPQYDEFRIDAQTGLATFPLLNHFCVRNAVTFDNVLWGNMSPRFTETDEEKAAIEEKDRKVAKNLATNTIVSISNPLEASLLHYTQDVHTMLRYAYPPENGFTEITIYANAIITDIADIMFTFAPADCPIGILVHPGWHGMVLLHVGAPWVIQRVHTLALRYFENMYKNIDIAAFELFLMPGICGEHYHITQERFNVYRSVNERTTRFVQEQEDVYSFDFVGLLKEELAADWHISKVHESGICTYESAKDGFLYSHTLSKQDPLAYPEARFGVAIALS